MLELKHITKSFPSPDGSTVEAIHDVSLTITEREFVAFVGPSGCGKTRLLRLIAGLDKPTAGTVIFDGKEVSATSRTRGMVFQDFALFPWLTVSDNIAFGLRLRHESEEKIHSVVLRYLNLTGLEEFKNSYPHTLSGGMQQRVAIARTLANEPRILLLDEPFGALDMLTRSQMQEFLAGLWESECRTAVLVTHDIEEAIFLADRIYVFSSRPGVIRREFEIPFPRRREIDIKFSDQFLQIKREISSLLMLEAAQVISVC